MTSSRVPLADGPFLTSLTSPMKWKKRLQHVTTPLTVAVMGCEVNGPGEAREADIGICGGKKSGLLIKKGEIIRKVKPENLVDTLVDEVLKMADTAEKVRS